MSILAAEAKTIRSSGKVFPTTASGTDRQLLSHVMGWQLGLSLNVLFAMGWVDFFDPKIGSPIAIVIAVCPCINGGSLSAGRSRIAPLHSGALPPYPKVRIHVLDPLLDRRWDEFVARHPNASVFHDRGWLEALARTYGYELYVLTSSPFDQPLENGIVVGRISSWITGARLVSLPFSDHCEPLLHESDHAEEFIHWMQDACDLQKWRYVELRPLSASYREGHGLQPSHSYWFHELNLSQSLSQIFQRLHKNSFQRKVQRAEREGLSCEMGRSEQLMEKFYRLLMRTRRRQQLLPQPRAWFKNLLECMREKLQIRVATKEEKPVAAMLTLHHGSSVVYKYGCSHEKFHNLGGMPFLFWKLIEEGKASGAEKIDLGRTDLTNEGLIAFKDRLGSSKKLLTYYRYAKAPKQGVAALSDSQALRQFFSLLPETVCSAAGRILYKHLG